MRRWLAREDLNQFLPNKELVKLSMIFKWFSDDFERAGGVRSVLQKYAPQKYAEFLKADYRIENLPYDWGLNAQRDLGKKYGRGKSFWDSVTNLFR